MRRGVDVSVHGGVDVIGLWLCVCGPHIDDGLIGWRLTSIWHEGTSNFLHSWIQSGHVLFIQTLVCRWNNFPRECMVMCQCGVLLSKYSSLVHTHGWLSHTNGCDEDLNLPVKERIFNKRRTHNMDFSTQSHSIVYMSSNQHQVPFFLYPLLPSGTSYHISS